MIRIPPTRIALLAVGLAILGAPAVGTAQTSDPVVVLPAAGTDDAVVYSLDRTGGKVSSDRSGRRTLVDSTLGPATFTDLKILPRGGHLLTDVGGRGVVVTEGDGARSFALADPGDRRGVSSASVVGYDSAGRADRLIFADDDRQRLVVYDRQLGERLWTKRLDEPETTAETVQVVALPNQRIAVAMNWPALGVSGIDIYDLAADAPAEVSTRYASKTHPNAPASLVTDTALEGLRDLFGLGPDRLLATTVDALVVIDLETDAVETKITPGDDPKLQGQLIAARGLPSGRIALASVEPGVWTRPHPNHRLYWLDSSFSSVIARTPSLTDAPWKVDAEVGHGGSGTSGFEPNLDYLPTAAPDALGLEGRPGIVPDPMRVDTATGARFTVRNSTARPAILASVRMEARDGACDGSSGEWRVLVNREDVVVRRGDTRKIRGTFRLPRDAKTGTWCARVRAETRTAGPVMLGPIRPFEVRGESGDAGVGTGRRIAPRDLGLRYAGDAGPSNGDFPGIDTPRTGCGCAQSAPALPGGALFFAIGGIFAAVRRRLQ